ncbi:MAG TPA: DNA-binding protein [Polaromonas sp.]|nr:DNA-binding protein [Polaromonas sp.]
MKYRFISVALTAAVLLLGTNLSSAAETKADAPQQAASKATAGSKSAKSEIDAKRKAAAKIKLVDINSAKKEELKKLPGISDAEAAKIIAGRPYGSKAHLVTRNIIDSGVYENLKQLVIAKQPNKDAAKNAAIYTKKK